MRRGAGRAGVLPAQDTQRTQLFLLQHSLPTSTVAATAAVWGPCIQPGTAAVTRAWTFQGVAVLARSWGQELMLCLPTPCYATDVALLKQGSDDFWGTEESDDQ